MAIFTLDKPPLSLNLRQNSKRTIIVANVKNISLVTSSSSIILSSEINNYIYQIRSKYNFRQLSAKTI